MITRIRIIQLVAVLAAVTNKSTFAQSPPPYTGQYSSGPYSVTWQHLEQDDNLLFEVTSPINSWATVAFANSPNTGHDAVDSIVCFSLDGVQGTLIAGNSVPGDKSRHRRDAQPKTGLVSFESDGTSQTCKFIRPRFGDGQDDVELIKPDPGTSVTQYLVWGWGNAIPAGCDAVVCVETDPGLSLDFPYKYANHGPTNRGSERVTFFNVAGSEGGGGEGGIFSSPTVLIILAAGGAVSLFTFSYFVFGNKKGRKAVRRGFARASVAFKGRAKASPMRGYVNEGPPPAAAAAATPGYAIQQFGGQQQYGQQYGQNYAAYNPGFAG